VGAFRVRPREHYAHDTREQIDDSREAHPLRAFQPAIARWGRRAADIAEEAANMAAVATVGDAVGKSCGVHRA
jgi:hypothetical protein